jgi:hypothetical protein
MLFHEWQEAKRSKAVLAKILLTTPLFHTGEWHNQNTSKSPMHATYEELDVRIDVSVPNTTPETQWLFDPNLPWADEHFAERVGGVPVNPAPSHERWPFAVAGNAMHVDRKNKFSHTYPERMWPKFAGSPDGKGGDLKSNPNRGIWFEYGDLNDLVNLLVNRRYTRQAYLPIWFPEDTGNTSNVRVPCSMGYHFMIRGNQLDCWYTMRSCDLVRHLQDDLYMAARLMHWVIDEIDERVMMAVMKANPIARDLASPYPALRPGVLHTTISSLHAFRGDTVKLKEWESQG